VIVILVVHDLISTAEALSELHNADHEKVTGIPALVASFIA
jgi:hypothetical protein